MFSRGQQKSKSLPVLGAGYEPSIAIVSESLMRLNRIRWRCCWRGAVLSSTCEGICNVATQSSGPPTNWVSKPSDFLASYLANRTGIDSTLSIAGAAMTMLVERTPLGQAAEFSRKDGGPLRAV